MNSVRNTSYYIMVKCNGIVRTFLEMIFGSSMKKRMPTPRESTCYLCSISVTQLPPIQHYIRARSYIWNNDGWLWRKKKLAVEYGRRKRRTKLEGGKRVRAGRKKEGKQKITRKEKE
jgi:hypothetical protein